MNNALIMRIKVKNCFTVMIHYGDSWLEIVRMLQYIIFIQWIFIIFIENKRI